MNPEAMGETWNQIIIDTKKKRAKKLESVADDIEGDNPISDEEIVAQIRTVATEIRGETQVQEAIGMLGDL